MPRQKLQKARSKKSQVQTRNLHSYHTSENEIHVFHNRAQKSITGLVWTQREGLFWNIWKSNTLIHNCRSLVIINAVNVVAALISFKPLLLFVNFAPASSEAIAIASVTAAGAPAQLAIGALWVMPFCLKADSISAEEYLVRAK